MVVVPYRDIAPDTLERLIESFVLREGTDYGAGNEVSLEAKVKQVKTQLTQNKVEVVYDAEADTFSLRPKGRL